MMRNQTLDSRCSNHSSCVALTRFFQWFTFLALFSTLACGLASAADTKPNVILILVDDLGWQDVKCYDIDEPSPMETPNLDALAQQGVLFWQGYSPAPVCAPSRAAILSGRHPARGEMTAVNGGKPPLPAHRDAAEIAPFCTARMPTASHTLAEAMQAEGYVTGHSGKWHISMLHYDYPKPYHHGFDHSTHHRGVQVYMKPDRLSGFATTDPKDPYRLDENGMPFDVPQDAALNFIKDNHDRPFFLYYATWLVHTPIVMRSEALLRKYEQKLGVTVTEAHKKHWNEPGQTNPFYCAMVEQLDYYMGQIFDYLKSTDDPRIPGQKLIENTYIIFTSDNGGMEGVPDRSVFTDNYPLDRGKISVHEGGVRVPLIVTGPGIPANVQTDVMANGLDFYPTILSLIDADKADDVILDGCDLAPLLTTDPTDASLVRDADGQVRDSMMWHFPQMENTSSIRVGDYKLVRRYGRVQPHLSLYRLYRTENGQRVRHDIEEAHDLAVAMPEKTAELEALLDQRLQATGGRLPHHNPTSKYDLVDKDKAPVVLRHEQQGNRLSVFYRNNGAELAYADLIYSPNNGREWLRASGQLQGEDRVGFELPEKTTHYFVNLIDENNFLTVYPKGDYRSIKQKGLKTVDVAVFAGYPEPTVTEPTDRATLFQQRSAAQAGRTVLMANDFEGAGLSGLSVNPQEAVTVVSHGPDAPGHSMRMEEVEGLPQEWMPLASVPLKDASLQQDAEFSATFDVMLDENKPGTIRVSLLQGQTEAEHITLGPSDVKIGRHNVAALEPGVWYHCEVACGLGAACDGQLRVAVTAGDGRRWSLQSAYSKPDFERPNNFQFIGLGETGTAVHVDNLVVTVEESTRALSTPGKQP